MLVGEAPGEHEERLGQPFVGASGQMLNQMLAAVGINRADCYLTNVVKIRPPRNDFSVMYLDGLRKRTPSPLLIESMKELEAEILEVKPNVIVPLGSEPLRAICGKFGITQWRGSILSSDVGKCVPTLHPAYVLRQYSSRPIVELDLKRVLEESTSRDVSIPTVNFTINPSYDQVIEYLTMLTDMAEFSFDIETTGQHVRCLGLSHAVGQAFCIPFISSIARAPRPGTTVLFLTPDQGPSATSHWRPEQEHEILRHLDGIFRNPRIKKFAQNGAFDIPILAREFGFTVANYDLDTMYAHHTCYCEMPKGLDFLTSIYTRYPYYSDYDSSDDHQLWIYNCWDACVTFEIAQRLRKEMVELRVDRYYYDIKHPAAVAYTRAETRGILVDRVLKDKRTAETEAVVDKLTTKLREITGLADLNPNSDKQWREYFYGRLGLVPMFNKKTKQPSTDKEARRKLRIKYPQVAPILNLLDEHSQHATLLSNFLRKPLSANSRLFTHYNPAGTDTDRLSSSEPLFEVGTNLQNIPRGEFRSMFIADSGWWLAKCDLSQAEFRIVAWLAKIQRIIQRYSEDPNWDVHRWVASIIYKKPEADILKDERSIAKNGVYGGNYSMHYKTAAATYKLDEAIAKWVLDSYRKAIPEIPQWWLEVQGQVNATRTTRNPLGRQRIWFDRLDDELYRTAYSDSAQSIVAAIINRAFGLADDVLPESEAYPLLQVHDEIVFAVKDGAERHLRTVKNLLEYPVYFPGVDQPLIIPADIGLGKDWHNQKAVKFLDDKVLLPT